MRQYKHNLPQIKYSFKFSRFAVKVSAREKHGLDRQVRKHRVPSPQHPKPQRETEKIRQRDAAREHIRSADPHRIPRGGGAKKILA